MLDKVDIFVRMYILYRIKIYICKAIKEIDVCTIQNTDYIIIPISKRS